MTYFICIDQDAPHDGVAVPLTGYDGWDLSVALLLKLREGVGSRWRGWCMPVGRLVSGTLFGDVWVPQVQSPDNTNYVSGHNCGMITQLKSS
jgi:hypothetical protein